MKSMIETARGPLGRIADAVGRGTTSRKVLQTTVLVGSFTLLAKGAAMVRELLSAAYFGTSDAMDAFVIAFLIPSFIGGIAIGPLASAVIPAYVETREREGREASDRLLGELTTLLLGLVALLSVLMLAGRGLVIPLLTSGFGAAKRGETELLLFCLLPTLLFTALATLWSAILNAENKFMFAAASPVIVPATTALAVLLFSARLSVASLAVGLLVGGLLQCVMLWLALHRRGIRTRPSWSGLNLPMRGVISQYVPVVAGGLLSSGTDAVDQAMAAALAAGSVAAISYGGKLDALVVSVAALSLGTALLPQFSRLVTARDWPEIERMLRTVFRIAVVVAVPVTAVLVFESEAIVRLLFQRGAFSAEDTRLVAAIQAFFLLQIPFRVINTILVRLLSALKRNRALLYSSMIMFPMNAICNVIGMRLLGAPGIALSTSVVYAMTTVYLGLTVRSELRKMSAPAAP